MNKFKGIKISEKLYGELINLREIIIRKGLDTLPKEALDYIKMDLGNLNIGKMIELCTKALRYIVTLTEEMPDEPDYTAEDFEYMAKQYYGADYNDEEK